MSGVPWCISSLQLLTDYQVVLVGVDNPMIAQWIQKGKLIQTDTNLQFIMKPFLMNELDKRITKILSINS